MAENYEAAVIGSGPNGLAAAITLAKHGFKVIVLEASAEIGGGARTAQLTRPGYWHDVCSSVYPLLPVSPFFRELFDANVKLEMVTPEIPLAHVVDEAHAVAIYQNLESTVDSLGADGHAYSRLIRPFLSSPQRLFDKLLAPPLQLKNPLPLLRFGWLGLRSANRLANQYFSTEGVKGMFAGMAAHSVLPLDRWLTGAVGLMFCIAAHATGWPIARGGARTITKTLSDYLQSLGGEMVANHRIDSLADLPSSQIVLFDTSPSQMLQIAGDVLPPGYRRALKRFRHGPGICKIDWALKAPIPWRADECRRAGTVHVGGLLESIKAGEQAAWNGQALHEPFLLVTQPSLFDSTRAPTGRHVAWAYCHVPHRCDTNLQPVIEQRMEAHAPGFRNLILASKTMTSMDFQKYNANYLGGDISGGAMNLWQFVARPALRLDPYSTPNKKLYLCSASTPPGPGVHGMCGHYAAKSAMKRVLRNE